ncbi:MAG TPA: hypothetical protein VJS92_04580 [Candidatus Polarisedimenticolaceae bacterium]|nr:hypothetical protein [Candidatus Polarisedimenticolaceae bacterium]
MSVGAAAAAGLVVGSAAGGGGLSMLDGLLRPMWRAFRRASIALGSPI